MRPCPCKMSAPHNTKFGSVRFCKHFLDIDSLKGRMNHLKEINACYKCLQLNHKASTCKARLKCPYCHQAGKLNMKHNPAFCANLDDTEFANALKRKTPENRQEPKQAKEESYASKLCVVWCGQLARARTHHILFLSVSFTGFIFFYGCFRILLLWGFAELY